MKALQQQSKALWVLGSLLCISMGCSHLAPAEPARAPETASAPVETSPSAQPTSKAADSEQAQPSAEPKATQRVVRKIKNAEMTVPVVKKARQIIDQNYKKPLGYEVEFEIEGKHFVGRVEQHYHPPGGELRPWGYHKGCSLYVVEQG